MSDATVRALATALWSRATDDEEERFLVAVPGDVLLGSVDSQGAQKLWVETARGGERAHGSEEGASSGLNFRKQISKHVAEADAVVAGIAWCASYRMHVDRIDWLAVIAVDDANDVGYLARVSRDGNERGIVGAREEWPAQTRPPFEPTGLVSVLDPARALFPNLLRQGLRDAARSRRRSARRR